MITDPEIEEIENLDSASERYMGSPNISFDDAKKRLEEWFSTESQHRYITHR